MKFLTKGNTHRIQLILSYPVNIQNKSSTSFIQTSKLLLISISLTGCYATTNINNEKLNYSPNEQSIRSGEILYNRYCIQCHGKDLSGNGPLANTLSTKPADLNIKSLHITQTSVKSVIDYPHYSSESIKDKIKYGNATMLPLKRTLKKSEIEDLSHYIMIEIRKYD